MQRLTDLVISFFSTLTAFLLSLPLWRDNEYFAESSAFWNAYFVIGFVLGVYVFYVFIGSLRILFLHAREEAAANQSNDEQGGQK
ncbi:Hypothetical protein HDN1F_18310 [gamma proteobacterium HdN1]|nr:Hypothetical protein HDN1F_18310 [gamma proteobacterium HdN1]